MEKSIYNASKKREGEMGWVDGARGHGFDESGRIGRRNFIRVEIGYGHNKKTVQIMQM